MSDSLNATVIVSVLALTISANVVELEDDDEDDEPPRLPALVDAALLEPDEDELPELEDAVDPEDTESPGERLSNETIVPLVGARSHVCASAILALATLSSALYTDAWADAMLDADDVVLVEAAPLEPEGAPLEPEAPLEPPDAAVGADGVVVLGVVVVGVVVGVVVVGVVVVVLGVGVVVVVLGVVVVGVVVVEGVVGEVEGVVGEVEVEVVEVVAVLAVVSVNLVVSDTNSVEPELVFSRLVLVDDELLFALLS
jgi:hypothetical protein